jgi:hypothetical protein
MHTVDDLIALTEQTNKLATQFDLAALIAKGARNESIMVLSLWLMRREAKDLAKNIDAHVIKGEEMAEAEAAAEKLLPIVERIKTLLESSEQLYQGFHGLRALTCLPIKWLLALRIRLLKSCFKHLEQVRINLLEHAADHAPVSERFADAQTLLKSLHA